MPHNTICERSYFHIKLDSFSESVKMISCFFYFIWIIVFTRDARRETIYLRWIITFLLLLLFLEVIKQYYNRNMYGCIIWCAKGMLWLLFTRWKQKFPNGDEPIFGLRQMASHKKAKHLSVLYDRNLPKIPMCHTHGGWVFCFVPFRLKTHTIAN